MHGKVLGMHGKVEKIGVDPMNIYSPLVQMNTVPLI